MDSPRKSRTTAASRGFLNKVATGRRPDFPALS